MWLEPQRRTHDQKWAVPFPPRTAHISGIQSLHSQALPQAWKEFCPERTWELGAHLRAQTVLESVWQADYRPLSLARLFPIASKWNRSSSGCTLLLRTAFRTAQESTAWFA